MTDRLSILRELAIPFPIPAPFRHQAKAYASQYFNQAVQERIYFNTLAVLVADAYLRILGFETDLDNLKRWNALRRLWNEAHELELPGLGHLECQSIASGQQTVTLPLESLSDHLHSKPSHRIGHLFVEIERSERLALLVGFLPETTEIEVTIADLQTMDDLIDYLAQQEPVSPAETVDLMQEFAGKKITYLRNWLNNIYTADWETSVRDLQTTTCKKKIQLAGQTFEMQLSVSQSRDESLVVRVTVQGESASLPEGMQVSVPDESNIYTETVNEAADLISIPLELAPGEEFWVELRLEASFSREYFIA